MYRYLKVNNNVVAFRSERLLSLAKKIIIRPDNLQVRYEGGYSFFDDKEVRMINITPRIENQYLVDGEISKDSASVYRVCLLIKGV